MRTLAASGPAAAPAVPRDVPRAPRRPLEPPAREETAGRPGHDFARVPVHAGGRRTESNVLRRQEAPDGEMTPWEKLVAGIYTPLLHRRSGGPWGKDLLNAGLWMGEVGQPSSCISTREAGGNFVVGGEDASAGDLFSQHCSPRICAGEEVPFKFVFTVDAAEVPRPRPFDKPTLSIQVDLEPRGGGAGPYGGPNLLFLAYESGEGEYQGPGVPLAPTFGVPRIVPPEPGTLFVRVGLSDPSSKASVIYRDKLTVVDCPRVPAVRRTLIEPRPSLMPPDVQLSDKAYATGLQYVISSEAPLEIIRPYVGESAYLDEDEERVEIEHDPSDGFDYYHFSGGVVRLPKGWSFERGGEEAE